MKLINLLEQDMVKKIGFGAKGYNIGLSLRQAFEEYHPSDKGKKGALDSYANQIIASSIDEDLKKEATELLTSISQKADDFKTLLEDYNFENNEELGEILFEKISGETDENKEDTLRFFDFNIDQSFKNNMPENVVGLLSLLDQFFDYLLGLLTTAGKEKPTEPIGFKLNENIDVYDFLNDKRDQIILDFGIRTFRNLQTQLMMGDEAPVRDWLIKNGYIEEEKMPFERKLTKGEEKEKEKIFKDLKGAKADFKKRYGKDAEAVMYATATKRAKMSETNDKITEKIKSYIRENLRKWFKQEDWVRIDTQGNIAGKCGTMKKGKATTRCLPRKKAQAMSKAERKATVAKKIRGGKKGKQFVKVK